MKSRVLVVDDEESIREFLDIMLRKEGYEVTCAEDGQQALDIIKKKSFDLVISDLQMPNLTGIEMLRLMLAEVGFLGILMLSNSSILLYFSSIVSSNFLLYNSMLLRGSSFSTTSNGIGMDNIVSI